MLCHAMLCYAILYYNGDHTNPPHPHHAPFNKSKSGFIKIQNLLNIHKTELVHCNLYLLNRLKLISGGGLGLCGPHTTPPLLFTAAPPRRTSGDCWRRRDEAVFALLPWHVTIAGLLLLLLLLLIMIIIIMLLLIIVILLLLLPIITMMTIRTITQLYYHYTVLSLCMCVYIYIYTSLSLSIYIYIYIHTLSLSYHISAPAARQAGENHTRLKRSPRGFSN